MPEMLPDGWLEKLASQRRADAVANAEYNVILWAVRLAKLPKPAPLGAHETAYSEMYYHAGRLKDLGWDEG